MINHKAGDWQSWQLTIVTWWLFGDKIGGYMWLSSSTTTSCRHENIHPTMCHHMPLQGPSLPDNRQSLSLNNSVTILHHYMSSIDSPSYPSFYIISPSFWFHPLPFPEPSLAISQIIISHYPSYSIILSMSTTHQPFTNHFTTTKSH